jgi:hypothetical protein
MSLKINFLLFDKALPSRGLQVCGVHARQLRLSMPPIFRKNSVGHKIEEKHIFSSKRRSITKEKNENACNGAHGLNRA